MATYAIGDIQGCYRELRALLDLLRFDPAQDQLWFVGDLVNRGPDSLETLRFVKGLGDKAVCVLGNHDLHLLAIATGNLRFRDSDSLQPVLNAGDRDELLHWLRYRPLMHRDTHLNFSMIHAGLAPSWDIPTAMKCAAEVEHQLRSKHSHHYFAEMYGNKPRKWDPNHHGIKRLRFITNCFTRLRFCDMQGRLALDEKGAPGSQMAGNIPWFEHPDRASKGERIIFGHWSTLGYFAEQNVWGIDTGCLWGGSMTALQLDSEVPTAFQYSCGKSSLLTTHYEAHSTSGTVLLRKK